MGWPFSGGILTTQKWQHLHQKNSFNRKGKKSAGGICYDRRKNEEEGQKEQECRGLRGRGRSKKDETRTWAEVLRTETDAKG
jgi:hypothetical protein